MKDKQYSGYITIGCGEDDETVNVDGEPIAEDIEEDIKKYGNLLSVSYHICNKECTLEEAHNDFIGMITGIGEAEYCVRYSEMTGYLWTDQELKVGGHDLIKELTTYTGKYLILCITYDKENKTQ